MVKVRRYRGGNGWEVDFVPIYEDGSEGPRVRKKSPRSSRSESMRWASQFKRKLEREGRQQSRREIPTLDELLTPYLERSAKIGGARGPAGPKWIESQESAYRKWIAPRLGSRKVSMITAHDLDALAGRMVDAGRKPRTIRNALAVLRGTLKLAKRYGHISEVPEFPRIHLNRPKRVVHSLDDLRHVLDVARDWKDPASLPVLCLGLFASLRAGEMMGLQWSDVDLVRGVLHVRRSVTYRGEVKAPKTESGERTVPLTSTLSEALRTWRSSAPVGVPWVFHADGQPVSHKWLKVRILPVLRRSALSESDPLHALRRTFCTQARLREIPEIQVKRWLGHAPSNDVTDLHYTGEFPVDVQREWIERLEEAPRTATWGQVWRNAGDARRVSG